MTLTKGPPRDEWTTADDAQPKLELFKAAVDPMRAAARRGLRRRLRVEPNEHDVDDAVVQAFNELWTKDQSELELAVNMGCTIAYRRGFDRGRRIARERKDAGRVVNEVGRALDDYAGPGDESAYIATMAIVRRCQEQLTSDQRAVIDATVEGTHEGKMSLREFASRRGTSYEACRRMCERGLSALAKCVKAAQLREVH